MSENNIIHEDGCGGSFGRKCSCGPRIKPLHVDLSWLTATRWSRPPLSEFPMWATQAVWKWAVPGGWEERVAKIGRVECRACSIWYRVYEDEPRPCPSCTERDARQAEKEDAARYFEGGKLREKVLLAELAAARKVIEVVADRQAVPGSNIPSGAEYVRQLVSALAEYHAVVGNR